MRVIIYLAALPTKAWISRWLSNRSDFSAAPAVVDPEVVQFGRFCSTPDVSNPVVGWPASYSVRVEVNRLIDAARLEGREWGARPQIWLTGMEIDSFIWSRTTYGH